MKKKSKGLTILLIYLIASFIGVSFAWMSASTIPVTDEPYFIWGNDDDIEGTNKASGNSLDVQSRHITFKAYYYDQDQNSYLYLGNNHDASEVSFEKLVPSKYATIRLDFTNTSTEIAEIALKVRDIEIDEDLKEYIFVGINQADGYNNIYDFDDPIGTYVGLSDAVNDEIISTNDDGVNRVKCSLTVLEELDLTPTTGTNVISIYLYIMLNRNTPNEMQGKDFSFGKIMAIFG